MAYIPVLNTIQVNVRYFLDNNNAENVFHVRATGTITSALLDTLHTVLTTWLTTEWKPIAAQEWAAKEIILTGLNSLFDPRKSYPIDPEIVGDGLAGALPATCTLAVKEDIGKRGKGVAGRLYWIGLANDQTAGDEVIAAAATSIVTALNQLATSIASTAGLEGICVPHRTVNREPQNPVLSDVITGFLLSDNTVDVQKDRLPFHKKHKRFPVA